MGTSAGVAASRVGPCGLQRIGLGAWVSLVRLLVSRLLVAAMLLLLLVAAVLRGTGKGVPGSDFSKSFIFSK